MKRNLTSLRSVSDLILHYFFSIDFYLLAFFSKRYPYLVFVFTFFFGNFGYTDSLTQNQFYAKFASFLFSSYLVSASIAVFFAFNIPLSRDYLYNLLGKDFVTRKIGNPGLEQVARFGGFAAAAYAANELGRVGDQQVGMKNANSGLANQINAFEGSPYLTPKEKARATKEVLKLHADLAKRAPEGTLDRITKVEAYKRMTDRVGKTFSSFAKIWGGGNGK